MRNFGSGFINWKTKNAVEIEGLLQGISMLKENGWFLSIIEGDLKMVMQMAIKLQNSSLSSKVAQSWRLQTRVQTPKGTLYEGMATNFIRVHRQGNKVTNQLERWSTKKCEGVKARPPYAPGVYRYISCALDERVNLWK